jgi:serine/threonine protein kinase, bacterial
VPGERFGPYQLLSLIGRGGMGEVYRAVDTRKNRGEVALKRLPAGLADDADFQRRFLREAELAARLRDPHVIPIHDYGEIDGQPYLDMRLVDGTDLASHLARNGPFDPSRAVDLVAQVAGALDAAHAEGLVHRDVKPHNILLAGGGGPDFAYLIDFGIAANLLSNSRSSSMVSGTAAYMAPERFGAGGDHRVDVYALGCVLHELLTGRTPFTGDFLQLLHAHVHEPPPRPSSLRPDLPRVLDDVVTTAMAKDPDRRHATAGALAAAARDAVTSRAVPRGTPSATTERAPRLPAARRTLSVRSRVLIAAAALVVVAVAVATAVVVVTGSGSVSTLRAFGQLMALAPDGRDAYVIDDQELAEIDTTSGATVGVTPLDLTTAGSPGTLSPTDLVVAPDGRHVYVALARNDSGAVLVVDPVAHALTATVPVVEPDEVEPSHDGRRVYVVGRGRGRTPASCP